jgi:hypothetical protein
MTMRSRRNQGHRNRGQPWEYNINVEFCLYMTQPNRKKILASVCTDVMVCYEKRNMKVKDLIFAFHDRRIILLHVQYSMKTCYKI